MYILPISSDLKSHIVFGKSFSGMLCYAYLYLSAVADKVVMITFCLLSLAKNVIADHDQYQI